MGQHQKYATKIYITANKKRSFTIMETQSSILKKSGYIPICIICLVFTLFLTMPKTIHSAVYMDAYSYEDSLSDLVLSEYKPFRSRLKHPGDTGLCRHHPPYGKQSP